MTCQQLIGDLKDVKNYRNFSHMAIPFFSVVGIPIKHSSLYYESTAKLFSRFKRQKKPTLLKHQLDIDFMKGFDILTLALILMLLFFVLFLGLQYTAMKDSSHH